MTLWNLMTDPPLDFQLRVLKEDIQQRIAITDRNNKPTYVNQIMKFKPEKVKLQENLSCLPRSAMFNVVSSTALNLNVLGDSSSYDRLLHFVGCGQRNDLLIRMELASKIRLQPLGGDCECAFLRMCNLCPNHVKRLWSL